MISREASSTYYIFTADIELYPSPDLIPIFLDLIQRTGTLKRTVYVTPIFEIEENVQIPGSKSELLELLRNGSAIVFHQKFCAACHTVPNFDKWKLDTTG